jgi:hypothetical protein
LQLSENAPAEFWVNKLAGKGIRTSPFGRDKIRLVSHLDFTDVELDFVESQLKKSFY